MRTRSTAQLGLGLGLGLGLEAHQVDGAVLEGGHQQALQQHLRHVVPRHVAVLGACEENTAGKVRRGWPMQGGRPPCACSGESAWRLWAAGFLVSTRLGAFYVVVDAETEGTHAALLVDQPTRVHHRPW